MLDDTKNRQIANAVDASGGAPVAEAQAMLEDTQTRKLAVGEASVMLQPAMTSKDTQTTRAMLLRARFDAGAFRLGSNAQLKCGYEAISTVTPDTGVSQEAEDVS